MLDTVHQYIQKWKLLPPSSTVIIGVSGGADSMALLLILKELGYQIVVAHCNFQLRNESSFNDEKFVVKFCQEHNIAYSSKLFDTQKYASLQKISIEMAARDLRYAWFEELRIRHNASAIAVAHHQNDSIETILINLINGTGIQGLTGIKPKNGHIIRPLLCISRADIETYLKEKKVSFVTDATNFESVYTRNIVRNQLIPIISKINTGFTDTMLRNIDNFEQTAYIYQTYITSKLNEWIIYKDKDNFRIPIHQIVNEENGKTILFEALKNMTFSPKICATLFENIGTGSGKIYYSNTHKLVVDRDYLIVTPIKQETAQSFLIHQKDTLVATPIGIHLSIFKKELAFTPPTQANIACVDFSKLTFPLTVRKWKQGDSFHPLGMKQKKKVSDFFIDKKINQWEKETCWIVESNGEIVWIMGYRIDNRYKITDKTTSIYKMIME